MKTIEYIKLYFTLFIISGVIIIPLGLLADMLAFSIITNSLLALIGIFQAWMRDVDEEGDEQ